MSDESEKLIQEMVKYCHEKGVMDRYCDMQSILYYKKAQPEEIKKKINELKSIYGD